MANRILIAAVLTVSFHLTLSAQEPSPVPVLVGENLDRQTFNFPKDLKKRSAVLVAGFSQGASVNLERCLLKLDKDFPDLAFSMVVLEGIPSLIRPRVRKAMRSKVPQARTARYLLFFEGREPLERFADYSAKNEDDAYFIGLKSTNTDAYSVSFKKHGNCDESNYASLRTAIELMLYSVK